MYFLSPDVSKSQRDKSRYLNLIIEIINVETTDEGIFVSQTSEGWSLLDVDDSGKDNQKLTASVYAGSPMILTMYNITSKYFKSNDISILKNIKI